MDCRHQLVDTAEAGIFKRLALEDAEPDLHLVQPTGTGGREMEGDIGVLGKPVFILLVRVQLSRMTWISRSTG